MKLNFKNIKNKIFDYRKFFFGAYGAAVLSFFISVTRDYVLVKYTNFAQQFFELIYFTSWFSLIVINLIMVNVKPNRLYIIISCLIASFAIVLFGNFIYSFEINFLILSVLVFNLWICGNIFSRVLILNKKIFLARSRDAISSVFIIFLCLFSFKLNIVIISSLICVTLLFLILSRQYSKEYFENNISIENLISFVMRAVLTNFSGLIMLIWAFHMNRSDEVIFGFDAHIAVRFTMYVYQFLSIGSIVMVIFSPQSIKKNIKFFTLSYGVLLITSALTLIFFNLLGYFLLPFFLAVARYFEILIASQASFYNLYDNFNKRNI